MLKAKNLRNRVAWTALYDKAADVDNIAYTTGSFYSYDILGNVDELVHVYRRGLMWDKDNGVKRITYDFDLVSGKVNQVSYQPGQKDAFYHKYVYDAENRITNVLTSADSINWDNDAYYQYYDHGPLARTVLGEQQVQGVNHAYNLQGWLKTFNPNVETTSGYTLKPDGSSGSIVGKPAYQVSLNYFNGDYKAISGATPWSGAAVGDKYRPLYNGNISSMAVNIGALNNPLLYNYQYDQLNRLVAMDAWKRTGNSWDTLTPRSDFQERISYDPNGNILTYKRNGNTFAGKPLAMDSLSYNYVMGTNRLDHVRDYVDSTNYTEDLDDQAAGNYGYDAIGNLIKDSTEGITSISWTVYGKISKIVKKDGTIISYTYDVSGNRISKVVIPPPAGGGQGVTTWYARDAQGNVMSVYEAGKPSLNDGRLSQTELHLYGSSRLGLLRRSLIVEDSISITPDPFKITMPIFGVGDSIPFARGNKLFELSNHLGNVLVTVNDKKLGISSNNSTIDYFNPQVVSAQDYYPFGMMQPGRSMSTGKYRYGFNGKENDNEVKGDGNQQDYGMRVYDPRLGKFLSVDPLMKSFPMLTPYQFASNSPMLNIDLDGKEGTKYNLNFMGKPLIQVVNLKVYLNVTNNAAYAQGVFVGNGYENKNTVVEEFHTYLNDVYNGGQDAMTTLFKPLTVNEVKTPVYYNIQVVPIESANENDYFAHQDAINNANLGTETDIPDNKFVDGKAEGNSYVFLKFGQVKNGVAEFQPANNALIIRRDRYANRNTDIEDFKNDVAHELGHKFLSRHPDDKVRNPGGSQFLHNRIGGIMNYNFWNTFFPGHNFEIFKPTKTLTQDNTNYILESVIKIKDKSFSMVFSRELKPQ